MATKPKKDLPTLQTHSSPCCGECAFCAPAPHDKKQLGCFVYPPEYLYGDVDAPEYGQFKPTESVRPSCKEYKPKGIH